MTAPAPKEKHRRGPATPFAERPPEEQKAILEYYERAHPSNHPADRDKAIWSFTWQRNWDSPTKEYHWSAGCLMGYLGFSASGVDFQKA